MVKPILGQDPALTTMYASLAYLGENRELFLLGAHIGFVPGVLGAAGDSVMGVWELTKGAGVYTLFGAAGATNQAAAYFKTLFTGDPEALEGRIELNAQFILESRAKMKKMVESLEIAATMLQREEVQISLVEQTVSSLFPAYQAQLGRLLNAIGISPQHPAYKPLVIGYSVGAVEGYLAEFGVEAYGLSLLAPGIGATLPVMLKGVRAGVAVPRIARVLKLFTRLNLVSDTAKMKRAFAGLMYFLDSLGPNALRNWFESAEAVADSPQKAISFVLTYSDDGGVQRLKAVAIGLSENAAKGLPATENPLEALATLDRIAEDTSYRGALKTIVVSADNAEAVARTIGRAHDLSKNDPILRAGFDQLFRNVDDIDEFMLLAGRGDDDALRAAARLATCGGR